MKNKFIECGICGWCLEILWTGFLSLCRRNFTLPGQSSIWMFPIYGAAAWLKPAAKRLSGKSVLFRGTIYTCCIFSMEYLSGMFLKHFHICPWDYSKAKLNIKGVIRLDYAPLWFCTGLLYENLLQK